MRMCSVRLLAGLLIATGTGVYKQGSLVFSSSVLRMPQQPEKDSGTSQVGQTESSVIKILQSLREKSNFDNFDNIVSTTDNSSRTLAHQCVQFGYISLLKYLVEWRIDLAIADVSGLTALNFAYLKGDPESIRILLEAGASQDVKDKLGRPPRDLAPERSEGWQQDEDGSGGSGDDESGPTRCICELDDDDEGGVMVMCDDCRVWQHTACMMVPEDAIPENYLCEQCRPDLHTDLLRRLGSKKVRRPRRRSPYLLRQDTRN